MSGRRLVASALLLLAGAAVRAPIAGAATDSLSLSVSPAAPNGVNPITITAQGSASTSGQTLVVIVNPAGTPCPTDYQNDDNGNWIYQPVGTGSFKTVNSPPEYLEHGSYLVCGWLADSSDPSPPMYEAQRLFVVSNPDHLVLAISTPTVTDGRSTTLAVDGVADVQNPEVFVTEKPVSAGTCGADPGADRGTPVPAYDPGYENFGSFSDSETMFPGLGPGGHNDSLPPGRYVLCGWLMNADGSSKVPLAPVASTILTLAPPTGTLAFSVPELVGTGQRFDVKTSVKTTAADVSLYLDLKPLPARGPLCATSLGSEPKMARILVDGSRGASASTPAHVGAAGVYVACAWLAWPHGTIDGPFAGRIVVVGRHQRVPAYIGITTQRLRRKEIESSYPISFQAVDGQLVNLAYYARYVCTKPGRRASRPIYPTTFPVFGSMTGGRFSDTFIQGSDRATISGRLSGRRATGTFTESYTSGGYRCASGLVHFTARRS